MRISDGWLQRQAQRYISTTRAPLARHLGVSVTRVNWKALRQVEATVCVLDLEPAKLAAHLVLEIELGAPFGGLSTGFAVFAVKELAKAAGREFSLAGEAPQLAPLPLQLQLTDGDDDDAPDAPRVLVVITSARANAIGEDRWVGARHAKAIAEALPPEVYDVRRPHLHEKHDVCACEREADVVVSFAGLASNRQGVQISRLARVGAVVLPVAREGDQLSCAFSSQEDAYCLPVLRYSDPAQLPTLLAKTLNAALPMLRRRAIRRLESTGAWQAATDRLAAVLPQLGEIPDEFPLSRTQIEAASTSPMAMAGLSGEQRRRLEEWAGVELSPVIGGDEEALLETRAHLLALYAPEQRAAFERYRADERLSARQESALLRHGLRRATRQLTGVAGRPVRLTDPEDWNEIRLSMDLTRRP